MRAPRAATSSRWASTSASMGRSEEHTSELQSPCNLVCRLLLEKKNHAPPPEMLAGGDCGATAGDFAQSYLRRGMLPWPSSSDVLIVPPPAQGVGLTPPVARRQT